MTMPSKIIDKVRNIDIRINNQQGLNVWDCDGFTRISYLYIHYYNSNANV